ncbi:hypothetical protein DVH24_001009 [Malus domestica]|uniref:Uncharacterized protein n=1 Tax=Malus domestica TaxID=3750 RepID=A0A498K478_MALDO|nr:hypothetical protein DVH24_001009 [Malus domestica]
MDLGLNYFFNTDQDWSEFAGMPSLTYLDMSTQVDNLYHSEFPEFISQCRNLTFLDLSQINLNGQIPPSIGQLRKLQYLYLSYNSLDSSIPSELGLCTNLTHLSLASNKLNGELPLSLSNLNNLVELAVDNNRFYGTIPPSIGQLRDLQYLNLSYNSFNSSIPSELGLCTNLTHLSLASNKLNGELPLSLSNLNNLVELGLDNNLFTGQILPSLVSNWTKMVSLQLQSNELSGEIPTEVGNMSFLLTLNLRRNHLTGVIPQILGNLALLKLLDLSHNHLSGQIPSFVNMFFLNAFNVSYNNLTGRIPCVFQWAPESAFVGNSGLCGSVECVDSIPPFHNGNSEKSNKRVLIGILVPGCGLLMVTTVIGLMFRKKSSLVLNKVNTSENFENQRLEPPTNESAKAVVLVVTMALACIRTRPASRPTMLFAAQKLSAQTLPCLTEPFGLCLSSLNLQQTELLSHSHYSTIEDTLTRQYVKLANGAVKIKQECRQREESEGKIVVTMALACIRTRPASRPTMLFAAQKLSAQTLPCLPEPFGMLTINKLMAL